jgi:hypothetical protein
MKSITRIFALTLGLVLAFAISATAQTSGVTVSTSSEAVGIHFCPTLAPCAWGAGDVTIESLDVFDWGAQKGNSLSAEGYELLVPSFNFNSYLGGIRITPDISSLVKKSNVSSDQFGVFAQFAAGTSTFSNAGNKFTFLLRGGSNYRLTTNMAWNTVEFGWGKVGSQPFYEASSGLVYLINPQTAQSTATRRFLAHRTARANAFKNAGW